MNLKIKVTREHIMKGQCSHLTSCAIAMAIEEVFPWNQVFGDTIRIFRNFTDMKNEVAAVVIQHSQATVEFIYAFDSVDTKTTEGKEIFKKHNGYECPTRESLPEYEFEIELTDELLSLVNIDEIKQILSGQPHLELV